MSPAYGDVRPPLLRRIRNGPRAHLLAPAAVTVLVLVVTLGALALVGRSVSEGYALDQATRDARRMADGLAAPLVTQAFRDGDPDAVRRLAVPLGAQVREGSMEHLQIWDRDGRLLWADEPQMVGERFELKPEVTALFDSLNEIAYVAPSGRGEHSGLESDGDLIAVYVGTLGGDGEPFVLETYLSPSEINDHRRTFFEALFPLALVLLAVVLLAVLPLGWTVSRRVNQTRREHARIVESALSAWHAERRTLAQDLHDGVVQSLSAVSYALPGVLDLLPDDPAAVHAKKVGKQLNRMIQNDLGTLRTLITDQFPDLEGDGLRLALGALADRGAEKGLDVTLDMPGDLRLDTTVAGAVYRLVREGLRNVEQHAHAHHAEVAVAVRDDVVTVRVTDDGQGAGTDGAAAGHVGLRLLAGLLLDIGGTLELRAGPSGGTVLEAKIPTVQNRP